ncbi:MAG: hypothetical protein ISR49_10890 [Alphaproteobacteria bacterium]|nr:hypothetical protein [Alphaproteobacteria bacterium]
MLDSMFVVTLDRRLFGWARVGSTLPAIPIFEMTVGHRGEFVWFRSCKHRVDLLRQFRIELDQTVHVVLDFDKRFGILEGLQRLLVGRSRGNLLANHDHGEQNELQERLRDPRDKWTDAAANGFRKADKSNGSKNVSAPHRADAIRNEDGKSAVEANVLFLDESRPVPQAVGYPRVRQMNFHSRKAPQRLT